MKYSVLLKPVIMVRIDDIEAGSQEEAVKKAVEYYEECAHDLVDRDNHSGSARLEKIRHIEHAEQELHIEALVDEDEDEDFDNSRWYIWSWALQKAAQLPGTDIIQDFLDKLIKDES